MTRSDAHPPDGSTALAAAATVPAATVPAAPTAVLQAAVLQNLAARLRPAGLFILALRPDGSPAFVDDEAGEFFRRYVTPSLFVGARAAGPGAGSDTSPSGSVQPAAALALLTKAQPVGAAGRVGAGVIAAAFPYVEKRQSLGVLVLAAKDATFDAADEDVLRRCSQLGLDATWLAAEADRLPSYGEAALLHQGRLAMAMARDQVRLASAEAEMASLTTQLANSYEELSLIYQISSGMRVNRRAGDFFKQACLDVRDVLNVRGVGVALDGLPADALADRPEPVVYGTESLPPQVVRRLHEDLTADLRLRKGPLLVNDLRSHRLLHWVSGHARQLLAVPLQRQEQVLGCIFALDKESGEFDSVDSKLLNSIANESAIYLENAVLFEDVHGLMMGLLHSLTSAVDAKDTYTCGHSERVALLSRHLARQAGLSDRDVDQIYMAGLLHDVGKIGVPEAVLQKAGRLTNEEFDQMKKHPEIGARILADVKQLREILPGVLHHHERYDGRGYPAKLAGKSIPLMGRIICLADCFDAMTSNRTYRKALPLEVALTEIRRCSGTQFDPALTEVFLRTGADAYRDLLRDQKGAANTLRALQQENLRAA